jgi:hypothetical protein
VGYQGNERVLTDTQGCAETRIMILKEGRSTVGDGIVVVWWQERGAAVSGGHRAHPTGNVAGRAHVWVWARRVSVSGGSRDAHDLTCRMPCSMC